MASIRHYVLSPEADRDIEEIFEYSQKNFGLDQAIKYITEFDELFTRLIDNPDIGRTRDEIKTGLRSFPKTSHVVFYRVLTDHVRIVRILHGSRDIPRYFQELPDAYSSWEEWARELQLARVCKRAPAWVFIFYFTLD